MMSGVLKHFVCVRSGSYLAFCITMWGILWTCFVPKGRLTVETAMPVIDDREEIT